MGKKIPDLKIGQEGWIHNVQISKKFSKEKLRHLFDFTNDSYRFYKMNYAPISGELGHPSRNPSMTTMEYIDRLSRVDMDVVCCLFKNIALVTNEKNEDVIVSSVKFIGPLANDLHSNLLNGNLQFGVRALKINLSEDIEEIKALIAFDVINF